MVLGSKEISFGAAEILILETLPLYIFLLNLESLPTIAISFSFHFLQGIIKGYIAHQQQKLVVSKVRAFPQINKNTVAHMKVAAVRKKTYY